MEVTTGTGPAPQTRRGLLGRLAVLAGAVGAMGFAAGGASARRDPGPAPTPVAPGKRARSQSLTLRGTDWRLHALGRKPGQRPGEGDAPVPIGALVDLGGRRVGRFRAAPLPGPAAMFQIHTFELEEGSLLGIGGGSLREAVYAVVGGTGRFEGVSGSYVARQSPRDTGGDGTAEFAFTFTLPEA